MTIKIIALIFLLVVFFALTIFSCVLLLGPIVTGFKKAPYVPSFNSHLRIMKQHLKLKKGTNIVDLGCGDGKALRFFSKEFGIKGTGYDLNPFVIFYGKLLNFFLGYQDISLIKSDFKKANLERYQYIYLYLFPSQLATIEDRVFETINQETIIISNSFTFVKHQPFDIITNERGKKVIYLYRK